jgi:uncharacterized surface protein with fasciclin (FAS1) repeats
MNINSATDLDAIDPTRLLTITAALITAGDKSSYYLAGLNVPITTISNTTIAATAVNNGGTYFNGLKALKMDIPASNGVLYVMNDFINPTFGTTTATLALAPDQYKLILQAITRASNGTTIVNGNTTTLFAPTNAAMIAAGYDSTTIANTTPTALATLVRYHLLTTKYYVFALKSGENKTSQGKNIVLNMSANPYTAMGTGNTTPAKFLDFPVTVTNLGVVFTTNSINFSTSNGVIHTIDAVLKP